MTDTSQNLKLTTENTLLLVVDIQDRLLAAMHNKEQLLKNANTLMTGVAALELPIIVSEQYPKGLGPTDSTLPLAGCTVLEKSCFSCLDDDAISKALTAANRSNVLLCGIESHVCVYQTAQDLIARGLNVHLVSDVVSSRTPANCQLGIDRIGALFGSGNVCITGVEMALFELIGTSRHPQFKTISGLIR
jgi:nicotinamidase-related amidase